MEGDAMTILPTLQKEYYDRIIAPRPKEGAGVGMQLFQLLWFIAVMLC
jgi:hypothetical protein